MHKTDWYDKFMILVGIFISLTTVPHMLEMINNQTANGQSPYGPAGVALALVFWLIYGFRHRLITMIITNAVGIIFNLIYLGIVIHYKL